MCLVCCCKLQEIILGPCLGNAAVVHLLHDVLRLLWRCQGADLLNRLQGVRTTTATGPTWRFDSRLQVPFLSVVVALADISRLESRG